MGIFVVFLQIYLRFKKPIALLAVVFGLSLLLMVKNANAESEQKLTFGLTQDSFLSQTRELGGAMGFQMINGRFQGRDGNTRFFGGADIGGSVSANYGNYNYVMAPELYAGVRLGWAGTSVTLGRKKMNWSRLDSSWELGLWQPFHRWDYLRPIEQGLTGAFVSLENRGARFLLFASPIFIPEQGPPFEVVEGQFSSVSPWFLGPINSLVLFDADTRIYYNVHMPRTTHVISHPSFGVSAQVGDEDNGAWSRISYIYKPRNQIATPFEGNLSIAGPPIAPVNIYPHLQYHHLASWDLGWQAKDRSAWLSVLAEDPLEQTHGPRLTYQKLSSQYIVGLGGSYKFFNRRTWGPQVKAGYMRQFDDHSREYGPLASANNVIFGSRLPFVEAVKFAVESTLFSRGYRRLLLSVQLIQEIPSQSTILMQEASMQLSRSWSMTLGADFLGSRSAVDDISTLASRFRGNDRLHGGILYVF